MQGIKLSGARHRQRRAAARRAAGLNKVQRKQVKGLLLKQNKQHTNESVDVTADQAGTAIAFQQLLQIYHDASTTKPATVRITRDNNVLQLGRMVLRGSVDLGDATNQVRVILFVWKGATNGILPTVGNVLDLVDNDGVIIANQHYLYAPINAEGDSASSTPVVISDRIYNLDAASYNKQTFTIKHNFKGMKVSYRGLNPTDIGERSLWLMAISDSGASFHPTVHGQFDCEFTG